jgi:hypothetical protein
MLLFSLGTVIARKAEHATEVIVRCEGKGCLGRCLRNGKVTREFTVSHEQIEANPAQPRERLGSDLNI